jgi:hypothetical protein
MRRQSYSSVCSMNRDSIGKPLSRLSDMLCAFCNDTPNSSTNRLPLPPYSMPYVNVLTCLRSSGVIVEAGFLSHLAAMALNTSSDSLNSWINSVSTAKCARICSSNTICQPNAIIVLCDVCLRLGKAIGVPYA